MKQRQRKSNAAAASQKGGRIKILLASLAAALLVALFAAVGVSLAMRSSAITPRTMLTAQYEPFLDGGVYQFVNAGSGKYLTAGNQIPPEYFVGYTNVFQTSASSTVDAKHYVKLIASNGNWQIKSQPSTGGYYFCTPQYITNTTAAYNVDHRPAYKTADGLSEWIIDIDFGGNGNYCIIRLASNPTMVLTAIDNNEGTASGTGITAAGNVVLKAYEDSDYQKWQTKSGGKPITFGYKFDNDLGYVQHLEGTSGDFSVFTVVYNMYDIVTYSSDNPSSVYESNGRLVTTMHGGAEITATVTRNGAVQYTYCCTFDITPALEIEILGNPSNISYSGVVSLSMRIRDGSSYITPTSNVYWYFSDNITFSASGSTCQIQAKSPGAAYITVQARYGIAYFTKTIELTLPGTVEFQHDIPDTIPLGGEHELYARVHSAWSGGSSDRYLCEMGSSYSEYYDIYIDDESVLTWYLDPDSNWPVFQAVGVGTTTVYFEIYSGGQYINDSVEIEAIENIPIKPYNIYTVGVALSNNVMSGKGTETSVLFESPKLLNTLMFGTQWWYFDRQDDESYVIYNMFYKSNDNVNGLVLTARPIVSPLVPQETTVTLNKYTSESPIEKQKWIIIFNENTFFIQSTYVNNGENYYLRLNGSKLELTSNSSLKTWFIANEQDISSYWGGEIAGKDEYGVHHIKLQKESMLYDTIVSNAMLDQVAEAWSGISSKIKVYGPDTWILIPSNVSPYVITFKNGGNVPSSDTTIADTYTYMLESNGNPILTGVSGVSDDVDWHHAYIMIYVNNFNAQNAITKLKNLIHECGHALKLQHPVGFNPTSGVSQITSIMNWGVANLANTHNPELPSWYDKCVLIKAWGK